MCADEMRLILFNHEKYLTKQIVLYIL